MAILKLACAFLALSFLGSCTGEVTTSKIDYLESDTHIRSSSLASHADAAELVLLKNETDESRVLIKLPTQAEEEVLDDILKDPKELFFFPWVITAAVISTLFGCPNNIVTPENLSSAKLVFDIVSSEESALDNKLVLNLLAKPWWQSANWQVAHPFSSEGFWTQQGGDTDSSFAPVAAVQNGSTLEFELTNYFKSLLSREKTEHFGLLLSSTEASLGETKLKSVQSSQLATRPRVLSVYTGPCRSSISTGSKQTYYLPQNSLFVDDKN